jgi:hypothetical protein
MGKIILNKNYLEISKLFKVRLCKLIKFSHKIIINIKPIYKLNTYSLKIYFLQ